jgi:plastocyanin
MSLAIISSDKVVFALAVGIPMVVLALIVVWDRPRKWQAVWALVSLAAIAGTGVAAWAAFRGAAPGPTPAAITTPATTPSESGLPFPIPSPPTQTASETSPATTPPPPACPPSGTELHLTAAGIAFDTDCLAAPADTAFTIDFDNKDAGTPHNIHIFSDDPTQDPNAQSLFSGDLVTGPATATYEVSPLPAGTYYFHCDVHPTQMFGTFVSG